MSGCGLLLGAEGRLRVWCRLAVVVLGRCVALVVSGQPVRVGPESASAYWGRTSRGLIGPLLDSVRSVRLAPSASVRSAPWGSLRVVC
jgi:hypothetical protein